MELEAPDSIIKYMYGENSPKETNTTEMAVTASVSQISPNTTTLSS